MILRFLSEDKKDSVDCKGLCYGEILMLQARILSSENWFWQVITDEYLTAKDVKSIAERFKTSQDNLDKQRTDYNTVNELYNNIIKSINNLIEYDSKIIERIKKQADLPSLDKLEEK